MKAGRWLKVVHLKKQDHFLAIILNYFGTYCTAVMLMMPGISNKLTIEQTIEVTTTYACC